MSEKNQKKNDTTLNLEDKFGSGNIPEQTVTPVEDVVAIHNDVQAAPQTVIYLPEPKYVVMGSNPVTAKAVADEPVNNDGGIVLPIPANVIPNGRGRNILKARQDKPVKNV